MQEHLIKFQIYPTECYGSELGQDLISSQSTDETYFSNTSQIRHRSQTGKKDISNEQRVTPSSDASEKSSCSSVDRKRLEACFNEQVDKFLKYLGADGVLALKYLYVFLNTSEWYLNILEKKPMEIRVF